MKNIQNKIKTTVIVAILGLLTVSCEKKFEELYQNPNAVTNIDNSALFTKSVRSLFQSTTDQASSRFAGMYAQYYVAGSTWRAPDQFGDGFDDTYGGMLSDAYSGSIRHIEEVLTLTSSGTTKNDTRNAIANIVAVLAYAKVTDAFGDVPYTEGGKGKSQNILQPKYDTQQSIYTDLIARLTTSIAVLKAADPAKAYPNSDPIFNNDLTKWVRFANSVRLRLAMRMRYADNALSRATVTKCLAEPLMEDPSHDAFMIETEGNGNEWFNRRTGFPSIKMSTTLINQLKSTADPRLAVFVAKDEKGQYSGMVNGLTDLAFGTSDFANKSDMGLALSSSNSKLYMITAAEVWLLKAEAALAYDKNATLANTHFRKGIETSLKQWAVNEADIATFLKSETATLNGTKSEEQIGVQMWLALTPNFFESWSHIRRTGFPVIPARTGEDLSKGATYGIIPKRFKYSSFELGTNTENANAAITKQGGNKIDTAIWWDKN